VPVVVYMYIIELCTGLTCGAVCVYPNRVSDCIASLKAAGANHIPVASGIVDSIISASMPLSSANFGNG